MPSKAQIVKYWLEELITQHEKYWMEAAYEENCSPSMPQSICFACGSAIGTERCHIIPKDKGGSDLVNNLHLLCKECHLESEPIIDSEQYLDWFDLKSPDNSGSYLRMQNACKIMERNIKKGRLDLVPEWMLKSLMTVYKDAENLIKSSNEI